MPRAGGRKTRLHWVLRAVLVMLFVLAVASLVGDVRDLTG